MELGQYLETELQEFSASSIVIPHHCLIYNRGADELDPQNLLDPEHRAHVGAWPAGPNLAWEPRTSLRTSHPVRRFWPSWWYQLLLSFSFRAVFYNAVTGKRLRSTTLLTKATE